LFIEAIFDDGLDRHYVEFTKEQTLEYIEKLKEHNKIKHKTYLQKLFLALERGTKQNKVHFAECTANTFIAKLQYITGSVLLPFSGVVAIGSFIKKLQRYLNEEDTALNALSMGGVYIARKNKLFVFVKTSNLNKYTITSDRLLYVLVHEMCHLYAKNNMQHFKKLFQQKYLQPFYRSFFELILDNIQETLPKDVLDKYTNKYITSLLQFESTRNFKALNNMYKDLYKIQPKLTDILYNMFLDVYSDKKFNQQTKNMLRYIFYHIYTNVLNIKIPASFILYQEILFPSEIISIISYINYNKKEYLDMLDNIFK